MSTEVGPSPAEFRANLRNKLASMPPVGPQGRELKAATPPTESAESMAAFAVPAAPRMKPNPSQGSSSQRVTAPAKAPASPLESIRAKAAAQAPINHDPTL